jgi:Phage Terminase
VSLIRERRGGTRGRAAAGPASRARADVARYLAGAAGRRAFRREMLVLEDGRRFGEAIEPWQEQIYAALDERDAAGRPRHTLAYIELARGHAKSTMMAGESITELALDGDGRRIYVFAADEAQAALLHEQAAGFVRRNPELERAFVIEKLAIRSPRTDSYLKVMSADAPSAHGLTPTTVIADELAQWEGRELWDAIITSIVKRRGARVIAITTPGWSRSSSCWEVREAARITPGYFFFAPGHSLASWLDQAEIARQRGTLPAHVFKRLHEGVWTAGEGAFLTAADLARCIRPERTARQSCSEPSEHVLALGSVSPIGLPSLRLLLTSARAGSLDIGSYTTFVATSRTARRRTSTRLSFARWVRHRSKRYLRLRKFAGPERRRLYFSNLIVRSSWPRASCR